MSRFKIKGMGRGFDGLVVELATGLGADVNGEHRVLHPVVRIINHNAIFGDRSVSFPVTLGTLFIDSEYLESYDDAPREYDSKNPNGKFVAEHRHRRYDLEVVLVEYERCMTATVLEHEHEDGKYNDTRGRDVVHTRYTENFLTSFDAVKEAVESAVRAGDLDDLVFSLRDIKDAHRATGG